jgi:hypothetical protein
VEDDLESIRHLFVAPEVIDGALGEVELTVIDEGVVEAVADALVVVDAPDREALPARNDRGGGVPVDGGAENDPATFIAVGRNVGPSAAETDPSSGARARISMRSPPVVAAQQGTLLQLLEDRIYQSRSEEDLPTEDRNAVHARVQIPQHRVIYESGGDCESGV